LVLAALIWAQKHLACLARLWVEQELRRRLVQALAHPGPQPLVAPVALVLQEQ
jgi:hypothetical protein